MYTCTLRVCKLSQISKIQRPPQNNFFLHFAIVVNISIGPRHRQHVVNVLYVQGQERSNVIH